MIVKSFGCSFIFGTELSDINFKNVIKTPSNLTWPALIAKHKKLDYQCFAWPGSGNVRISEQILNELRTNEPAIYIIGWTWTERFDYANIEKDTWGPWKTITPWDNDEISDFYYKKIHSQYLDKLNSLMAISLCLQQLQSQGVKFLMTYMDELLFERKFHCSQAMQLMQDQVRPHLHNFEGLNFLDWSIKNGYPISPVGKHPLESAHQAAAEYVLSHNLV